jgi:hypothetical protein
MVERDVASAQLVNEIHEAQDHLRLRLKAGAEDCVTHATGNG